MIYCYLALSFLLRVFNTEGWGNLLRISKVNKGFNFGQDPPSDELNKKIQDLHTTDDRKPGEESHGASYETQLALELNLLVSLYLVVGRCVEEDVNKLECRVRLVLLKEMTQVKIVSY